MSVIFLVAIMLLPPFYNAAYATTVGTEWEVEFTMDSDASGTYQGYPYSLYSTGSGIVSLTVSGANKITGSATATAQMTAEATVEGQLCTGELSYPATFKIQGTFDRATNKATVEIYGSSPPTKTITVYCGSASYTAPVDSPFTSCGDFLTITLADGVTEESTFSGEQRDCGQQVLIFWQTTATLLSPPDSDNDGIADSKDPCPDEPEPANSLEADGCPDFDFELSVEPQVVNIVQGEPINLNLVVSLISGTPKPVTIQFSWVYPDGRVEPAASYTITPTKTQPISIETWCETAGGSFIGRYEATSQGVKRTAEFTLNIMESAMCAPDSDRDGISDDTDECPDNGETVNAYQDSDGCPDSRDTDGDGISDTEDQCVLNAETVNGASDADGCPENPTIMITGPVLAGGAIVEPNIDGPEGWHHRWDSAAGDIKYETCGLGGGYSWCITQELYQETVLLTKECNPGSNGAYGYCGPTDSRTTPSNVWLVSGEMRIASNWAPVESIGTQGGYSPDTGVVISYGAYTAALKGTDVVVGANENGTAGILVIDGSVDVWETDNPETTATVSKGEQLITRPGQPIGDTEPIDSELLTLITPLEASDPAAFLQQSVRASGLVSFAKLPAVVQESLPSMIGISNVNTGLGLSNYITMQSVSDKYAQQVLGVTGQFVTTLAYQDRFGRDDSNNNLNVFLQISHTDGKINSMRGVQLGGDTVVVVASDGTRSILTKSAEIPIPQGASVGVPQKFRDVLSVDLEPKETPKAVLEFLNKNIDFINESTGDHLTHYILVQTVPDVYAEKVLGITGQFVTTLALQDRYGREDSNGNLNVFLQISHTAEQVNSLRGIQLGGDDIEVVVNGASQGLMTKTVELILA